MTKQPARERVFRSTLTLTLLIAFLASIVSAQQPARPRPRPGAAKTAPAAQKPQYKAIFEPVSYSEDLNLTSVFFVGEETGWVSGAKGTILHTSDGGQTWTAQMGGDPQSEEAQIDDLYFLDANTGWAVGANENTVQRKLLGTRDGQNWRQVGTMGTPHGSYTDYIFTSAGNGLFLEGGTGGIHQTRDGGRTWKPVVPQCKAKVRIAGLNKELGCRLMDLFFLTPSLGWAAGAGPAGTAFVLRTQNGGATWDYLFVEPGLGHPDENHFAQHIFFTDENNGFLVLSRADKLLVTTDGGKSWETAPVAAEGSIRFADPGVGWIVDPVQAVKLLYSVDGGRSWPSRTVRFPTYVKDFSLPSRQRAYIVGDSGMVFRYRVVEASHENAEAIAAPLMPGVGQTLDPELAEIRQHAEALEAKLKSLGGDAQNQTQTAEPQAAAEEQAGASAAPEEAVSFEQAAAAPASEFIADCCAAELKELQSDVGSFVSEVPVVTTKYRSLNLIFAGLQMVSKLINHANGIGNAFVTLKGSHDASSAMAAVQEILANVDSAKQMVAAGFDSPPPLPDEPLAAVTSALSDAADSEDVTAAAEEAVESTTDAASGQADAEAKAKLKAKPASGSAKKLKDKLKKKIKIPW